jgi:hypothetical protein
VCLAAGQEEADRVAQCVDQRMYTPTLRKSGKPLANRA